MACWTPRKQLSGGHCVGGARRGEAVDQAGMAGAIFRPDVSSSGVSLSRDTGSARSPGGFGMSFGRRCRMPAKVGGRSVLFTRRPRGRFPPTVRKTVLPNIRHGDFEGFGSGPRIDWDPRGGAIPITSPKRSARPLAHLMHSAVSRERALEIDLATRRSLELTRTIREGKRDGSLLAVLDRTATPWARACWPTGWRIR